VVALALTRAEAWRTRNCSWRMKRAIYVRRR